MEQVAQHERYAEEFIWELGILVQVVNHPIDGEFVRLDNRQIWADFTPQEATYELAAAFLS